MESPIEHPVIPGGWHRGFGGFRQQFGGFRSVGFKGGFVGFVMRNKKLFAAVVVVVGVVKIRRYLKEKKLRKKWAELEEGTVVVHTIPSTRFCPDASPFTVKLLTYLRMAGIKYQLDLEMPFGPQGKFPWVTVDGSDFSDSQLIVEFLNYRFDKNFNVDLNSKDKAALTAMRIMGEQHLLWGLAHWRFIEDNGKGFVTYTHMNWFQRNFLVPLVFKKYMTRALFLQGTGRHTLSNIHAFMTKDLSALSCYLGENNFFAGAEPCEDDCAIFGLLAQVKWQSPGSPYAAALRENFKNLDDYCERMKTRFWPDWNQCLNPPRITHA